MKLVHFRNTVPNFGDDLNGALWPSLAPRLFEIDDDRGFVGIGTIIGMNVGNIARLDVFSSGAGYDQIVNWANKEVTVHCVRGPVTARLLGLDPVMALTDGAILTPLAQGFPAKAIGGNGIAVIPHYETIAFPGWGEACRLANMRLIDPRGTPQDVIRQIAESDLVLTESLHGAILADTYDIPWIPFATSRNFGTSKWVDWMASVRQDLMLTLIPPPNPGPLMSYGKRAEPFGSTVGFTLEQAAQEFEVRMEPPSRSLVKEAAKAILRKIPATQRLLDYTPARTAAALMSLAAGPTTLSRTAIRAELCERMLEKLKTLEQSCHPVLV
jgi:succinoglycan biosynthesis protein ExoV